MPLAALERKPIVFFVKKDTLSKMVYVKSVYILVKPAILSKFVYHVQTSLKKDSILLLVNAIIICTIMALIVLNVLRLVRLVNRLVILIV